MTKSTDMNERSVRSRGTKFVSPSVTQDHTQTQVQPATVFNFGWQHTAGALASALLMRKFPKATLVGLVAWGVYESVRMMKGSSSTAAAQPAQGKNPFQGEGLMENLH